MSSTRPRRIGLPELRRMRHDRHFVDHLTRPSGRPIGRLIPAEEIGPNPDQPRSEIGDLTELVASVREKGVLEPIIVRPHEGRFQIVAGERRYRAALEVGLDEVPCIVKDASDEETLEIALIENLQRLDLSAFEEAEGLRSLAEKFGYTHADLAKHIGKSRTSITESLALAGMPGVVRDACRRADIRSKSLLIQVVRQRTTEKMLALVERLSTPQPLGAASARTVARAASRARKQRGRPKHYTYRFADDDGKFDLALRFKKGSVSREELIAALQRAIEKLEA